MGSTLFMLGLMASPILAFIVIVIFKQETVYEYDVEETETNEPGQAPLPTGTNVIEMRDAEALAYISKHPAMNTHRSRA